MLKLSVNIGVLALQGDFLEHVNAVKSSVDKVEALDPSYKNVTVTVKEIRTSDEVNDDLDGLIVPGGESTVLTNHLTKNGFLDKIRSWTQNQSKFTWGTCAGLILLSNKCSGQGKDSIAAIGGLDITCVRNAFGRQINSFEENLHLTDEQLSQNNPSFKGVFIRAPGIKSIDNDTVDSLCRFPDGISASGLGEDLSSVIGVRQGNIMACSFHPELTTDTRWHEYFVAEVLRRKVANTPSH